MECVLGAWVLTAGEMGRIVLTEGSSKGYFLGYGHICMCNNYDGTSCFSCSPNRYGHLCMCNGYEGTSCFSYSPHRYGHLCMCNGYGLIGRGLEGHG